MNNSRKSLVLALTACLAFGSAQAEPIVQLNIDPGVMALKAMGNVVNAAKKAITEFDVATINYKCGENITTVHKGSRDFVLATMCVLLAAGCAYAASVAYKKYEREKGHWYSSNDDKYFGHYNSCMAGYFTVLGVEALFEPIRTMCAALK